MQPDGHTRIYTTLTDATLRFVARNTLGFVDKGYPLQD
jgi:hypothetical protein